MVKKIIVYLESAESSLKKPTRNSRKSAKTREPRLSRLHPPSGWTTEAWQRSLRQQFGREQSFKLENIGSEPIFSEFRISNPDTRRSYRVAIRGAESGQNYCSCPDYATNDLGTCKHIEFTLAKLARKRGGRPALEQGHAAPYSEVYLRYGAQRDIHFRPGTPCPPPVLAAARRLFDEQRDWL